MRAPAVITNEMLAFVRGVLRDFGQKIKCAEILAVDVVALRESVKIGQSEVLTPFTGNVRIRSIFARLQKPSGFEELLNRRLQESIAHQAASDNETDAFQNGTCE